MIERENLFPDALSKRVVGGHVLYAPVVAVVPGKLVFVSGLLARNRTGETVGKGDMGAQIHQVGENLKAALAAAGATLADLVRTQTFTTDIDASSTSTCGWSISARRCQPAPQSRYAGSRIQISWSRWRPSRSSPQRDHWPQATVVACVPSSDLPTPLAGEGSTLGLDHVLICC
jgi:enamine deaminase RidA (YjgF/YER057c/UK114 family)